MKMKYNIQQETIDPEEVSNNGLLNIIDEVDTELEDKDIESIESEYAFAWNIAHEHRNLITNFGGDEKEYDNIDILRALRDLDCLRVEDLDSHLGLAVTNPDYDYATATLETIIMQSLEEFTYRYVQFYKNQNSSGENKPNQ